MDFRQVLTRLEEAKNSGIDCFDSIYVAGACKISTEQASKYLGRLYRMGFLKRTKRKRLCISKTTLCYKGYCYEYNFSTQGVRYVQWMINVMPIEAISHLELGSEVAAYLPGDVMNSIKASVLKREVMKYKGSNRALQSLGILTLAIPAMTKRLKETEAQRDELERTLALSEKNLLEKESKNKELKDKIRNLENLNSSLRQEFDKTVQQMNQRGLSLAQKSIMQAEADYDYISALQINEMINEKVAKELGEVLVALAPDKDAALKVIEHIYRRYDRDRRDVKELLAEAKKAQEEAQSVK